MKCPPIMKNAFIQRNQVRCMFVIIFNDKGVVHYKFVSRSHMVNFEFYKDLQCLQKVIHAKDQRNEKNDSFITMCLTHIFLSRQFLQKMTSQSTYLPDLTLYDFWMFPRVQMDLKEKIFQTIIKI